MKLRVAAVLMGVIFLFTGCSAGESDDQFKERVAQVLKENPEILFEVIQENPVEFMDAFQAALDDAREAYAEKMAEQEKAKQEQMIEDAIAKPLQPSIREDEAIRGDKQAPLVLVEYSDFECPACRSGFRIVRGLKQKYGDQIQVIYKHLPLIGKHPHALPASKYYEALRLQDPEKAFAFHDQVFINQERLQEGESFLNETAKNVGADMKRLAADLKSDVVVDRIKADMQEATSFGFNGTPGFILNGVPLHGAYPLGYFESLIGKLQERGVVKLAKSE